MLDIQARSSTHVFTHGLPPDVSEEPTLSCTVRRRGDSSQLPAVRVAAQPETARSRLSCEFGAEPEQDEAADGVEHPTHRPLLHPSPHGVQQTYD